MKKVLIIAVLVLMVASSLIAGTLAIYTQTIDGLASGSVIAKEFILLEDGTDTFETDVKIAPTETVTWQFSVKNFNDQTVTETAMDLLFNIDVTNTPSKSAVDPLVVTVYDENGTVVGEKTDTGVIQYSSQFSLQETGQTKIYTVTVYWPSDNTVDFDYAGATFGTTVSISVTGTQISAKGKRINTASDDPAGLQPQDNSDDSSSLQQADTAEESANGGPASELQQANNPDDAAGLQQEDDAEQNSGSDENNQSPENVLQLFR